MAQSSRSSLEASGLDIRGADLESAGARSNDISNVPLPSPSSPKQTASSPRRTLRNSTAKPLPSPPLPHYEPSRPGPSPFQQFASPAETERFVAASASPSTAAFLYTPRTCRSRRSFLYMSLDWANVGSCILAIYTVIFSGIWLAIALIRPHYGSVIADGNTLSPNTVSTIVAVFAKSIELAFVAVFIISLGQFLSRTALSGSSRGISIGQMHLRTMILQPGLAMAHAKSLHGVWRTWIGIGAILATIAAMLFTTASDTIVSPKPMLQDGVTRDLTGEVLTSWANTFYLQRLCPSLGLNANETSKGQNCRDFESATQAYHTFLQYSISFQAALNSSNGQLPLNQTQRPPPIAMLYDSTNVTGTWLGDFDMVGASKKFNRIVNNVTAVMPHAGLLGASIISSNNIPSPQSDGYGELQLDASVISPSINVICANGSGDELAPVIYNGPGPVDTSQWPVGYDLQKAPNATVFDDIFGWGKDHPAPIFPMLPEPYGTIINASGIYQYFDSFYILFGSNGTVGASQERSYMLCSLDTKLVAGCSTLFHLSVGRSSLTAKCGTGRSMAFDPAKADPKALRVPIKDWVEMALIWGKALNLNAGINNGRATLSTIIAQTIPMEPALSPRSPSIAETLALLAGSTLLESAQDASFDGWNPDIPATSNILSPDQAVWQTFTASVAVSNYASGWQNPWQMVFILVLFGVFALGMVCLVYLLYLLRIGGLVNDFIEPQNLFALALGSPPSGQLDGACGAGPTAYQARAPWWIRVDNKDHVFIGDANMSCALGATHLGARDRRSMASALARAGAATSSSPSYPSAKSRQRPGFSTAMGSSYTPLVDHPQHRHEYHRSLSGEGGGGEGGEGEGGSGEGGRGGEDGGSRSGSMINFSPFTDNEAPKKEAGRVLQIE